MSVVLLVAGWGWVKAGQKIVKYNEASVGGEVSESWNGETALINSVEESEGEVAHLGFSSGMQTKGALVG